MDFLVKGKNKNRSVEKPNFWTSYADIMAGLLLMFILILLVVIFDYRDVLQQKQDTIDQMLGIKSQIIHALQQEFADTDLLLEIDAQTGAIRFPGKVFFDTDSTVISTQGRKELSEFIPKYIEVLLREDFIPYISSIIIEGHTDDIGSYIYNMELSQNRALAVAREIYSDDFPSFPHKDILDMFLTANGRSFGQPVINDNGVIDRDKSRRVEFKFRLKDDQMIDEIREVLGG